MITFFLSRRSMPALLWLLASLSCVNAWADPPARVGVISLVQGAVEFRNTFQSDPARAAVNWPVTAGNLLVTGPQARTELRVGSTVIRLDAQSQLEVTALDDVRLNLVLSRGSATVRVRNAELASQFGLQTPQGQVVLLQPGRFRVDTGLIADNTGATSVHVMDGLARFDTAGTVQPGPLIAAGSRLDSRYGTTQITDLRAPQAADGFDSWSLARDAGDDRSQALRYLSPEITGYQELDRHGIWIQSVEYGPVWTPTVVVAGWAPYRSGRWTWVAPWGWTWVDSAPWGYAPSHYGRWISLDNRWCWTPGPVLARPVWAPALVSWRGGTGRNARLSWSSPPVEGWVALAPREAYVPPYRVSQNYVQQINVTQVSNRIDNRVYGYSDNRVYNHVDRRVNHRIDRRVDNRADNRADNHVDIRTHDRIENRVSAQPGHQLTSAPGIQASYPISHQSNNFMQPASIGQVNNLHDEARHPGHATVRAPLAVRHQEAVMLAPVQAGVVAPVAARQRAAALAAAMPVSVAVPVSLAAPVVVLGPGHASQAHPGQAAPVATAHAHHESRPNGHASGHPGPHGSGTPHP